MTKLCPALRAMTLALAMLAATVARSADSELDWAVLTPAQQQTLAPLQRSWSTIDSTRRQKWVELAGKFPSMPADERQRVQTRMNEWAKLTPAERATARIQFQEVRRLPAEERQAQWQAYQALPAEDRHSLAQKAKPAARAAASAEVQARSASAAEAGNVKRNMVRSNGTPPRRVVTPTVVQARPGATTTSLTTPATPPLHNQAGLPKIVATPGFVDGATLLPRRGPQGAAVQATASAPAPGRKP